MNYPVRKSASSITGAIEAGPRGLILRDKDGILWRLHFSAGDTPAEVGSTIAVRGRITEPDRIDVEYFEPVPDE